MRKAILISSFLILNSYFAPLALSQAPTTTAKGVTIDANGNVLPATVNGHVPNLPAGTTLGGAAIVTGTGLPSQTGNSGKYLTTNGTAASWATIDLSGYLTGSSISDTSFASTWNGVTTIAPSKNAVYDWIHSFDTDDNGKVNVLDLAAGIPKTNSSGVLSLAVPGTDYVSPSNASVRATGTGGATTAYPLIVYRNATTTPANGMSSLIQFAMDDNTSPDQIVAEFGIKWEDATHSTRTPWFTFRAMNDGNAMADLFQIIPDGTIRLFNAQTHFYAQILSNSDATGNRNYYLPAGSGDLLTTKDGSDFQWLDFNARKLLAADGTTESLHWSDAEVQFFGGAASIGFDGSLSLAGGVIGGVQTLSGAGAINSTTLSTAYTSTGGSQALTLDDGTNGQIKVIAHVADGGSGILTPTTKSGYSTITFTNAGDAVTLQFFTTAGWIIIGQRGVTVAP